MPEILVTLPEFRKARAFFEKVSQNSDWRILSAEPEEESFLTTIRETSARLAIVGTVPYSEAVYSELASNASPGEPAVLCRFGVGMDSVKPEWARKWGVLLANTPNVLNRSVAEHTIWLLGAAAKRLALGNEAMRRGEFPVRIGTELYGKKLLIAGFGGIARETAKIARFGFGMEVTAFGRRPLEVLAEQEKFDSSADFLKEFGLSAYSNQIETLLPEADAVAVLLSSNPETFHFFDADRFRLLRENVIFVNTSRGALVDENALFDFLCNAPNAFASLDVFETEPYEPRQKEKDLRTLENIFLTPHQASSTFEANLAMARCALEKTRTLAFSKNDSI